MQPSLPYKPAPPPAATPWAAAALAVAALLALPALAAGDFKACGLILPGGAVRVGEDRYRLPDGFDASVKYYKGVYKPEKYRRRPIVNQPGIKAIHVDNPEPDAEWEGFNLYEYQGEVRLFILVRRTG